MRIVWLAPCLVLLAGCGSSLVNLANTQARFLAELERAMPSAVDAHDAALKRLVAIVERAEEQALAQQRVAEITEMLDAAIAGARLDLANPTRDAVREALLRMVKSQREQRRLTEAARAAREAKARAMGEALSALSASAPPLVANQRTLANYLEAHSGLPPIGGVAIAEPVRDIGDLLERLKRIGETLDAQFDRAKAIFEAAKKAAGEE